MMKVSIKIIDKNDDFDSNREIVDNEVEVLTYLPKSPTLIDFYEVSY